MAAVPSTSSLLSLCSSHSKTARHVSTLKQKKSRTRVELRNRLLRSFPCTALSTGRSSFLAFSARLIQETEEKKEEEGEEEVEGRELISPFDGKGRGGGGDDGDDDDGDGDGSGGSMDRISSVFIFGFWAAFLGYSAFYAPNQTPMTDKYYLEKLLYLKGNDGFELNQVLVSLWNLMGVMPAIYCMLLIPTGRSARSKLPIWPFTSLSVFFGAFALLPYFGLWQPPPPKVSKEEIEGWPLKILDSKILAGALALVGAFLVGTAAFAGQESWAEFLKYFRSSRFIHIMSLDFLALNSLIPFWVFNDIDVRKWSKEGSWATFLAFIPVVGPALYLVMRPALRADEEV